MPKQTTPARPLWQDRFTRPSVDDLLDAVGDENRGHFLKLRASLRKLEGLSETLEWCGLPWRWALVYRLEGDSEAAAYLVPNPETPAAVFRVTHEEVRALPIRKLSRYTRDGLAASRLVAGVCWPEWSVQAASNASDLRDLFRRIRESRMASA